MSTHGKDIGPHAQQIMCAVNYAETVHNLCPSCFRGSIMQSMLFECIHNGLMEDDEVDALIQALINIRAEAPNIRLHKLFESISEENPN